jgi:hypothetical protein
MLNTFCADADAERLIIPIVNRIVLMFITKDYALKKD